MGDIAGVVLAGGATGFGVVADCVAFGDTVSDCGHNSGGVFIAYKSDSVFSGEVVRRKKDLRPQTKDEDTEITRVGFDIQRGEGVAEPVSVAGKIYTG